MRSEDNSYIDDFRNPTDSEPPYVIKLTDGMGYGVFATRTIKIGELIATERPLLVSPRQQCLRVSDADLKEYGRDTISKWLKLEWEKTLETYVKNMETKDKDAFMNLANSHQEDRNPITGIIRTNGFGLDEYEDGRNENTGVFKIGSRINHRCVFIDFVVDMHF